MIQGVKAYGTIEKHISVHIWNDKPMSFEALVKTAQLVQAFSD